MDLGYDWSAAEQEITNLLQKAIIYEPAEDRFRTT